MARTEWLDFAKGISIICIVIGHSGEGFQNLLVFSFHIPIFFIISGYLFANNNSMNQSGKDFAYKRFRTLVVPYFITILITIFLYLFIVSIINYLHNNLSSLHQFMSLTVWKNIFLRYIYASGRQMAILQPFVPPVGPEWFLLSLFCGNIIFYFTMRVLKKSALTIQALVVITLTLIGYYISKRIFLPWSIDIALVSQIFIFAGYQMRMYDVFEKKLPFLVYAAIFSFWIFDLDLGGISMNNREYNHLIVSVPGAIAASYLLLKLSRYYANSSTIWFALISHTGRYSLVILCFHLIDNHILGKVLTQYFNMTFLHTNNHWIALSLLRLFYSLLIVEIIRHLPVLKSAYYPAKRDYGSRP